MITLRIEGDCQDRDYFDKWDDEYEVDLPQGTNIQEVVFDFLKTNRGYDDNNIDNVKDLIKTGKWHGGEWKMLNPTTLRYDTDVMGETFSIFSPDQIRFEKETREFYEAQYK